MAEVQLCQVEKRYANGTVAVNAVSLTIGDGEFMVFVGPSGCGKSTLLRLLAGLELLTAGHIKVAGRIVDHLGPRQRNVAMVFQNYALYPHMTVRGNIEFPLRMTKLPKQTAQRRLGRVVALLGLEPLLHLRPRQLSGGQRQRVAMARALVRDPDVFLMDEPLSNLDAKLRVQIRGEIAALQRRTGTTTAYVTHDQVEAMTLGDRVAVMNVGTLQQVGTPQALYDAPVNTFVASFIGSPPMNLFPTVAQTRGGALTIALGRQRLPLPPAVVQRVPRLRQYIQQPLIAGLRPEGIGCDMHGPHAVTLDVKVTGVENLGHEKVIFFEVPVPNSMGATGWEAGVGRGGPQILAARCRPHEPVSPGMTARLAIQMDAMHFFTCDGRSLVCV